jgi:CDP-diacylglycerol--glycerol-3-phosphate 3-phosphatidyltransferase
MHLTVPTLVDQLCIWVIVLTTIYSGVEYFIKNKDCIDWKNL